MAKAKLDLKLEATKGLYAGAGAADLAVATVKDYVADVQKKVTTTVADLQKTVASIDLEPKALGQQASTAVTARVGALTAEGKARRAAVEAKVAELQGSALELPLKVQAQLVDNVAVATTTYAELAKRGELLVRRLRRETAGTVAPSGRPVVPTAPKSPPASKAAAKATTSTTTTARKSAAKSTGKKSTAKKAPAKKAAS